MRSSYFFLFIVLSLLLHVIVASVCSLHIEAKASPFICSWLNIISEKDLFFKKKNAKFPVGVNFHSDDLRRNYFSLPLSVQSISFRDQKSYDYYFRVLEINRSAPITLPKRRENYFYLWEQESILPSQTEEIVSYKAYVSPQGQIIFLYPDKLPLNSYGNFDLQAYLHEASFFLNDKFFWTKLEGVVK